MQYFHGASSGGHEAVMRRLLEHGTVSVHFFPWMPRVQVPEVFKKRSILRLDFSYRFNLTDFKLDSAGVSATLSFSMTPFFCFVPWESVSSISSESLNEGYFWGQMDFLRPGGVVEESKGGELLSDEDELVLEEILMFGEKLGSLEEIDAYLTKKLGFNPRDGFPLQEMGEYGCDCGDSCDECCCDSGENLIGKDEILRKFDKEEFSLYIDDKNAPDVPIHEVEALAELDARLLKHLCKKGSSLRVVEDEEGGKVDEVLDDVVEVDELEEHQGPNGGPKFRLI